MQIVIMPSGTLQCLYSEELDLHALGSLSIRRASHVEPSIEGRWKADLSPVGGIVLGPFPHRSAALEAERNWLETNWLVPQGTESLLVPPQRGVNRALGTQEDS